MKFLWFTLIISACVIHGVAQETPEQKIIGRWKMEARIENYAAKWSVPKWNELVVKEYFANGTYRFTYEDSTHVAVNMRSGNWTIDDKMRISETNEGYAVTYDILTLSADSLRVEEQHVYQLCFSRLH